MKPQTNEQNKERWRSCARWEHKHGFQDDLTTDEHNTKEQAQAICDMLKRDGLGGERCHFPLDTWVERVQPKASPPTPPLPLNLREIAEQVAQDLADRCVIHGPPYRDGDTNDLLLTIDLIHTALVAVEQRKDAEIEQLKQERNRIGMEIRREFLPKLEELKSHLEEGESLLLEFLEEGQKVVAEETEHLTAEIASLKAEVKRLKQENVELSNGNKYLDEQLDKLQRLRGGE